jgi:hypothetical protein
VNDSPLFIDSLAIPADVLILGCLVISALGRLCRNESIGALAALKEFYWSLVVGACLTGAFVWWSDWHLASAWWVALGAPMASSYVIEILLKKAQDIRDLSIKETIELVFDELQKRFKTPVNKP